MNSPGNGELPCILRLELMIEFLTFCILSCDNADTSVFKKEKKSNDDDTVSK